MDGTCRSFRSGSRNPPDSSGKRSREWKPVTSDTQQVPAPDLNSRHRARSIFAAFLGVMLVSWILAAAALAQGTASKSDEALRVAREASDRKDFDHAASTLRRALKGDPENKDLLSLLARVLAWSRHFDESISTYRTLLARYPDDAFDRAGYARALAWSGHSKA